MLSWIPLLGPIIQGISSIFTGFFSEKTAVVQAASATTIAETEASVKIIQTTEDDVCLRILRDAAVLPVVVWVSLIGWDTIVASRYPWLMFHVANYPTSVSYLPYAVLIFLFGNIGINTWKNR